MFTIAGYMLTKTECIFTMAGNMFTTARYNFTTAGHMLSAAGRMVTMAAYMFAMAKGIKITTMALSNELYMPTTVYIPSLRVAAYY